MRAKEQTLSHHLVKQIEDYFEELKNTHPFYLKLQRGEIGPLHLSKLLASTRYLLTQTPIHLKMALEQSKALEHFPGLAPYFEHHISEEVGHDAWATEDIERLKQLPGAILDERVQPAMVDLVRYVRDVVATDPVLFVPYILFAEYLAVIAVPHSVKQLETYCNVPASVLTVFTRHAELDQEHAVEDSKIIDDVVAVAPVYRFPMERVLANSCDHYSHFLAQVAQ